MSVKVSYQPTIQAVQKASENLTNVALKTPLIKNDRYSREYGANIFFKREDLQLVRSYKIRGAYHKISSLSEEQRLRGIVCASAGNHAQGVALSCKLLQIQGVIYMPSPTPKQKIDQVKMFGEDFIEVVLIGDSFDDASYAAKLHCEQLQKTFIPPFDDEKIIEGQATVGLEIMAQSHVAIDYIFVPVGGGGLSAGLSAYVKQISPQTRIIGVEPHGAPSMSTSIKIGKNTTLEAIDNFVDGASVRRDGYSSRRKDLSSHFRPVQQRRDCTGTSWCSEYFSIRRF